MRRMKLKAKRVLKAKKVQKAKKEPKAAKKPLARAAKSNLFAGLFRSDFATSEMRQSC
jgi:hypothetical protein